MSTPIGFVLILAGCVLCLMMYLPQAASVIDTEEYITTSYSRGFPVGYSDTSKNHYL
jgi:hypothetical protein